MSYQIIGLNPNDQYSAHLLCRHRRAKDVRKYGLHVMISLSAEPDDSVVPVFFSTAEVAQTFIAIEANAGSNWLHTIRPVPTPPLLTVTAPH
ncbi:MAG: hypothetical protein E6R03_02075 [Hyphomicrobiaceae bacterium]|nr:MAG: hypothetical protein E6R03_02075 [Hyphomicrobiaceae bacterium]